MRALALRSSGTARPGPKTFSRRRRIMALLPAPEAGRCPGSVTCPPASTRSLPRPGRAAPGQRLAEPLGHQRLLAQATDILGGEHDRQQPGGRAGQGGCGVGPVMGLDGGKDGFSTARTWHGSGVPWLRQGRATSGAGTNIPTARNRLLRNGPELGETADCHAQQFPRPRPDVHGPPSPAGFGIFRVLGSAGSLRHTANWRGGRTACIIEFASLQETKRCGAWGTWGRRAA